MMVKLIYQIGLFHQKQKLQKRDECKDILIPLVNDNILVVLYQITLMEV